VRPRPRWLQRTRPRLASMRRAVWVRQRTRQPARPLVCTRRGRPPPSHHSPRPLTPRPRRLPRAAALGRRQRPGTAESARAPQLGPRRRCKRMLATPCKYWLLRGQGRGQGEGQRGRAATRTRAAASVPPATTAPRTPMRPRRTLRARGMPPLAPRAPSPWLCRQMHRRRRFSRRRRQAWLAPSSQAQGSRALGAVPW
jgi:hypothetical protein